MNGDVVDQVGEQQVKAEEGGADEEEIHRMHPDPPHSGEDEEQEEEQQERHRSGKTDLTHPGTGIEPVRHHHAEVGPGQQAVVLPRQPPTLPGPLLVRGGYRLPGKVDGVEVGARREREVFDLGDVVSKAVAPFVQPLRSVGDPH